MEAEAENVIFNENLLNNGICDPGMKLNPILFAVFEPFTGFRSFVDTSFRFTI